MFFQSPAARLCTAIAALFSHVSCGGWSRARRGVTTALLMAAGLTGAATTAAAQICTSNIGFTAPGAANAQTINIDGCDLLDAGLYSVPTVGLSNPIGYPSAQIIASSLGNTYNFSFDPNTDTYSIYLVNQVANGPDSFTLYTGALIVAQILTYQINVTVPAITTVPGAPTIGTAVAGNHQATVSFTPPASNGGSAITSYTVTSNLGITATGTSSPITVTGLTNGDPYSFTVKATNSVGTGPASGQSNVVTPASVPNPPTMGVATGGNGQASVSFAIPTSTGGSPITGYTVTSSPGGLTGTGVSSPVTVAGLVNGTTYTFTATATNAVGTSAPSAASNPVTPATVPSAPVIGAASGGHEQATVTFAPPATNGGASITNYTVTSSPGGITGTGTGSPIVVTGLTDGTAYTFSVTASNSAGTGPASAPSNQVTPATAPSAPTVLGVTGGNAQVTVAFLPPTSYGGAPVNSYTVTASPGGLSASGMSSPLTVTGLTNGTAYTFVVAATNSAGTGPASAPSAAVTPMTVPDAPVIGTATAGNGQATVTFAPPASNGGAAITSYTVVSSPGGLVATGTGSPLVVTGLTNGTAYTFTATATNSVGSSPASGSSNAVTPATVPGAPTIGLGIAGNGQATIAFLPPVFDGGSAIVKYTVTSIPGNISASGTASPIVVPGLTNGTPYVFVVTATNSVGTSPSSAVSISLTPLTTPDAPTIGTATAGNADASVTFTPPANTGGATITGYTVTSSPGGIAATGAASPIVVPGLTNGVSYTFTVTAMTSAGTGPASAASNAVTPAAVPDAPAIGTATGGNAQATVTFTAPVNTGGSPITTYTVTSSPGGLTATGTSSPLTVTGLANGTAYTFRVTATNAQGTSIPSGASNAVTPATVPGAPAITGVGLGIGFAKVNFTAPASNGGSAITTYTVVSSPGGITATGAVSPITVNGLTQGGTYTFTVTATNSIGTGPSSAASAAVTIPSTPTAPPKTINASSNSVVTVHAAADAGGGPFTNIAIVTAPPTGVTEIRGLDILYFPATATVTSVTTVTVTYTLTTPYGVSAPITAVIVLTPPNGQSRLEWLRPPGWTANDLSEVTLLHEVPATRELAQTMGGAA